MNRQPVKKSLCSLLFVLLFVLLPLVSHADPVGNDYCITPAFVTAGIKPNLLLMIDNSSSMYDLVYADEGKITAGAMIRQPNYCYDPTYMAQICSNNILQSCTSATAAARCGTGNSCISNTYAGYFDRSKDYDYDFANKYFITTTSFPSSTSCDYFLTNTLCVKIDTSVSPNKVSKLTATGNYLNWLTASKLDVEKQVITGGKYVNKVCKDASARVCSADSDCASGTTCGTVNGLQAESRGCVGQGFIKDALTSDFVNYAAGATDPNTKLGITFSVRGPIDSANASSPSRGGQTFIEIYRGSYNDKACQAAIEIWGDPSAKQTDVRTAVENCLNYNSAGTNYCSGNSALSCAANADCIFPGTAAIAGKCSNNASFSCTADGDCGTTTTSGTCSNIPGQSCTDNSTCVKYSWGWCTNQGKTCAAAIDCTIPGSKGSCNNQSKLCTVAGDCTIPEVFGSCSNGKGACTPTTDCNIPAVQGKCSQDAALSCSVNADCGYTATPLSGKCSLKHGNSFDACTTDAECGTKYGTCTNPSPTSTLNGTCSNPAPMAAKPGTCTGYVAVNTGSCNGAVADNTGNCIGGGSSTGTCTGIATTANRCNNPAPVPATTKDYSPCINPNQSPVTKTKIAYSHTIQTCWSYWKNGNFSNGDSQRLTSKCDDVYSGWGVCSADNTKVCTAATDCSGAGLGTCLHGPTAIRPGNPAYVCSQEYMGQFCSWPDPNSTGSCAWNITNADAMFASFCNSTQPATVIDPTDSAATTSNHETVPALLSGIGVEAQLGMPIGSLPVKVNLDTPPTGLVQEFSNQIRIGAMSFNQFGSATEASSSAGALIVTPRVCSNDATKLCTMNIDCGAGSCNAASSDQNLDGGKILYPIGYGLCSALTATLCVADSDCSGSQVCLNGTCGTRGTTICTTNFNCSGTTPVCVSNSAGSHTTAGTLIKSIDDIRANAWTPFAESFYNAIGYFAQISSGLDAGKSRINLRLNSINAGSTDFTSATVAPLDFNENLNPSQYRCQQNNILLVSDGSSSADQASSVNGLASLYAAQSGLTAGACSNYLGSKNLPIMSWIAKNRRISDFSLTGTASTAAPTNARDSITTHVVLNGGSNGQSGDCDSYTLLNNTAVKGGTTLKLADNPQALSVALRSVFQDVAAKAASGTAASILSNSEGSGANILQAVFYPKKIFENQTAVNWIGEMQNLWYFVDPLINNSTIREDTDGPDGAGVRTLNLVSDYVARFAFDNSSDKTMVQLYQDTNGDGAGDTPVGGLIDPDYVKSIWRGGKLLWARNLSTSPRTLKTSINGTSLINFSSPSFPGGGDNSTALAPYLNVTVAEAPKLINFVHGQEQAGYRSRTVDIKDPVTNVISTGVWRLGDIISSTPRVQSTVRLGSYNLPAPGGYNDSSYLSFINSSEYQNRGMVYVGANDGMLHAFNMGKLSVKTSGNQKATLSGTNLGKELWAFIPKNFLPYLKYSADPAYQHLYAIDGRTLLLDASIGNSGACGSADYWTCDKLTNQSVVISATDATNNTLDPAKNTWRTVVIGGMGLGGASAKAAGTNNVVTPIADPADGGKGLGYSSYFALDVTDPNNPVLLWEFNDPALGYATSGPAIVRVGGSQKNGRWFAVFGSGPTGPIDTGSHQFQGRSSQPLQFFVVDLRTGTLVKTIETGIANAFAGSMIGGAIDADRWNPGVTGNYQDDAIYMGYVKKAADGTWTDGGVGRIMIDPVADPTDANVGTIWHWSKVIDDIGPVTTAIARLQDKKNRNLWLFSGTGRYFYRDSSSLDDYSGSRMLFGIKEPCYNKSNIGNYLDKGCTDTITGSLVNQTTSLSTLSSGDVGWRIDLDGSSTAQGSERMVTDTVALTNGAVFLTSFKPTMDLCGYGGDSFLWGVKYDTGGVAPANTLKGKALIQLSTGEFKEVDLSSAFTGTESRLNRRMSTPMTGKPPSDAPPVISSSSNKPLKKIIHIQEH